MQASVGLVLDRDVNTDASVGLALVGQYRKAPGGVRVQPGQRQFAGGIAVSCAGIQSGSAAPTLSTHSYQTTPCIPMDSVGPTKRRVDQSGNWSVVEVCSSHDAVG